MNQTQKNNEIDYAELPAADIAKTREFFTTVFGWKFEDYGPDYTSFFDGRLSGGFTRRTPVPGTGVMLVFYATDLAATQEKIRAAGGSITRETFSFPGGRGFHFADPNGNELAVWSE